MNERIGLLDHYHLDEVLKGTAKKLGERCGMDAIDLLCARFHECIGAPEADQYTYIWRSAVEEHEQDNHKDDFRNVIVDTLRDVSLGLANVNPAEARKAVRVFLESPYPTLVRVGIFVCGECYPSVGRVFWDCLKVEWLVEVPYWHELFWLIKKTFPQFSASEQLKFLDVVVNVKGNWKDELNSEVLDEILQRDLLYPAVGLGSNEVNSRFERLVQLHGSVREHADFHIYSTSGWVGDRSPVASDELVGQTDTELLDLMRTFVPDSASGEGPTYRGMAASFTGAVRASEDGFAKRISLFFGVPRPYQHGLLRGLKERWVEDKREIDWTAAVALMRSIVLADAFKIDLAVERTEGWEPAVRWVISDIADLIKAGASDLSRPLSNYELSQCVEIIDAILLAVKPSGADEPKDAVSHAINSPRGRTLESAINVGLAWRRNEVASNESTSSVWACMKPIFDRELDSSESGRNAEFSALGGMYCTNLHYLSADWVETNFDRIFSTFNDAAWRCAAQGFAYQRHLYNWLYAGLNRGGHLRKMVFVEGLPDSVSEKALQFVGLAYLEGMERLDGSGDGLLSELVLNIRTKELSQLCWFFWTTRGWEGQQEVRRLRILDFWTKVTVAIRADKSPHRELQSALNLLAVFIADVTVDVEQMWVEAAPHAEVRHHGRNLVEQLARLAKEFPDAVARVFIAALNGFVPDYRREDVIRCVEQLAESGRIDEAELICNKYAARGSTLLKDTYESLRDANRLRLSRGTGTNGEGSMSRI